MTYRYSRRTYLALSGAMLLALAFGCIEIKDDDSVKKTGTPPASAAQAVDTFDVSAPSYDVSSLDTAGSGARFAATPADDSAYSRISESTTGAALTRFPARIPKRGAAALHLQVLLDRARFSPGIIDGVWGDNAVKALTFFMSPGAGDREGSSKSDSTVSIDQATYRRLRAAAGTRPILTRYAVTAEDVKGPFAEIPDDVYQQAKLQCLCYSSAAEGIAEKFHTSQKLLAQLNPTATLAALTEGATLIVPDVDVAEPANVGATGAGGDSSSRGVISPNPTSDSASGAAGTVVRLIISREGFWTHAVDASGRIVAHYPSTLGGGYDPSPTGEFRITNIAWNPAFHYQPTLFAEVSDKKPEARLPKGPNSPVGIVWMALSKPHYGIHGTSSPETIGYANSHGCVRLTNWDATELGRLIAKGTPVQFQ